MKGFDIKKELSNLKTIQPDLEWKNSNREILSCQIQNSASNNLNLSLSAVIAEPRKIIRFISQPAFAVFSIILVLVAGGGTSIYAANNSKPGDSLYIAKIISEQAQLAITFNAEKKDQLGLKFANDRAITIAQVLAETNSDNNQDKVEKLTGDFKKEISLVRTRIKTIKNSLDKNNEKVVVKENLGEKENLEEQEVFSANLSKDDRGVQISEPNKQTVEPVDITAVKINETEKIEINTASSSVSETVKSDDADTEASKIVAEAEKLFDEKNYNGAGDQLQKVDDIIKNGVDSIGEVKGVSESASSSPTGK